MNLSNFVNTYYQYRDVESLNCNKRLLIVGPGQGLDRQFFQWAHYDVVSFDIDAAFEPDHIGSVHDLSIFRDGQFDVAIASHVLEHMAVPYLDSALTELARVARYVLIYLPVGGRFLHCRLVPPCSSYRLSVVIDFINPFDRSDGVTPRYCAQQHFWELGRPGFSVRAMRRRFSSHFEVLQSYRNHDWPQSHNFVLRSKHRFEGGP